MKVEIRKCDECSGALGEEYLYPVPVNAPDGVCPYGHERYLQEKVDNPREKIDKIEIVGEDND